MNNIYLFVLWKLNINIHHVAAVNTLKREQTFDYIRYRRFNENIIT